MHGLEINTIFRLLLDIHKIQIMLAIFFLFKCGSLPISDGKIFVNIQEGFALMCRLCLRNFDIFAEDFFFAYN